MSPLSFFFNEILDERDLKGRYAFVNRAPVMTAWATIVLERLGFERAEALSVGEFQRVAARIDHRLISRVSFLISSSPLLRFTHIDCTRNFSWHHTGFRQG